MALPQVENLLRQAVPVLSHGHRGPEVVGGDVTQLYYEMFYPSPAIIQWGFPVDNIIRRAGRELDLTYQTTTTLFFLIVSTVTDRGGEGMSNTSTGTFTSQEPWSLLRITLYCPVWDLTGFTM